MVRTSPRRKPAGDAPAKRRCLVTGGSGFLGRHLVQQLLDSGRWDVTVFDIRPLEGEERATCVVGDLRKRSDVEAAVQGEPPGTCRLQRHVCRGQPRRGMYAGVSHG